MDQATNVASYARPLLIVTTATAETWADHLALFMCSYPLFVFQISGDNCFRSYPQKALLQSAPEPDRHSRGLTLLFPISRMSCGESSAVSIQRRHELHRLWCPFGEVQQDLLLSSLTIG
jgi:hypothetical protein